MFSLFSSVISFSRNSRRSATPDYQAMYESTRRPSHDGLGGMQSEMVLVRDRPSVTDSHPKRKKLSAVYAVNTRNTNVTQKDRGETRDTRSRARHN